MSLYLAVGRGPLVTQGRQSEGVKTECTGVNEWEVGTRDSKHTALLRTWGRGQELEEDTGSEAG